MRKINNIVIHCTAGYGDLEAMKRFWKNTLGWRSPGYHLVVDLDGKIHEVQPLEKPSNGVKGHNSDSIHISYIGGVDTEESTKSEDTRTDAQKASIIICIFYVIGFLLRHQKQIPTIKGHRDFSPDQNRDGVISSWERIKECPSFDAITEYKWVSESYQL
jgi:N-acetylmuramoyl-L-alanine amidase